MGRRHMQLTDIIMKIPKYIECAISVNGIIPWIKDNVNNSDLKTVVMLKEDFAKEVGLDISEVESIAFYQNLKFVLLVNRITLQNGIHNSGKKAFIMKNTTYRDKMPKYWKSRSKLFKQLMKSKEWNIMLEQYEKNKKNKKNDESNKIEMI